MISTQAFDLHDVDAYLKSRNLVDDKHRSYCLRWLKCYLSGFCGADTSRQSPLNAALGFDDGFELLGHGFSRVCTFHIKNGVGKLPKTNLQGVKWKHFRSFGGGVGSVPSRVGSRYGRLLPTRRVPIA